MATTNLTNLKANALTNVVSTIISTSNIVPASAPKISSITYPGDDTAASTAGGQTITLTGSGFNSGAAVLINGSYAGVVTVVSSTSITFTAPANSGGTYPLYVINTDGGTAISVPGISYSGVPSWSTASGSLATVYETNSINNTVTATGDATISYSLYSGTLPTGSSLNTSTGAITGTSVATEASTTYTFTIRATDGQNQDTDRSFSITVNPDVVTWSSPADGYTTNLDKDVAMATFNMSATSAAGKSITYTANSLPTGLSISGATITGTPTVLGNTGSLITATAATTGRTATRTFNWIVSVAADTYWMYTTLLLNGEGSAASNNAQNISFVDGSTNAFTVTRFGDTHQGTNSPFSAGSWSNYFDGTGDYLQLSDNAAFDFGTGDFTIECWFMRTATPTSTYHPIIGGNGSGIYAWGLYHTSGNEIMLINDVKNIFTTSGASISNNRWYHVAAVKTSGVLKIFVNGVQYFSAADTTAYNITASGLRIGDDANHANGWFFGYISNLRVVKGTAVYTSAFTPSTTALTAVANTSLLTCQSNRIIDNSTNAFTITKNGDTTVTKFSPFKGVTDYSPTTHGGSAYFDGTGDYLTIPSNAAFSFSTGDFTIEAWVNNSTVPGVIMGQGAANTGFDLGVTSTGFPYASVDIKYGYVGEGSTLTLTAPTGLKFTSVLLAGYGGFTNTTGPNYGFGTISATSRSFCETALIGQSGAIGIGANNANFGDPTPSVGKALAVTATVGLLSSTTCNAGVWNHLALSRSGTTLTLYLNGVSVATATWSSAVGSSSNLVSIGATTASGSAVYPSTSNVSNLRIVKGSAVYTSGFTPPTSPVTAISGTSLLMNFTNAGIIDQTGINNILTVGDAKISTVQQKYGSSSMFFDGTGDYLTVLNHPNLQFGTGDFTVECWIFATAVGGAQKCIISKGTSTTGWELRIGGAVSGGLDFSYASTAVTNATVVTLNTWHHVAVTRSGTAVKIFLDGVNVGSATTATDFSQTDALKIGESRAGSQTFSGYIDDLRITKGYARYTANFTPPTAAFFTK